MRTATSDGTEVMRRSTDPEIGVLKEITSPYIGNKILQVLHGGKIRDYRFICNAYPGYPNLYGRLEHFKGVQKYGNPEWLFVIRKDTEDNINGLEIYEPR